MTEAHQPFVAKSSYTVHLNILKQTNKNNNSFTEKSSKIKATHIMFEGYMVSKVMKSNKQYKILTLECAETTEGKDPQATW